MATDHTSTATSPSTPDQPKTAAKKQSLAELRATADAARAELAGTLDAIEFKLNVPHQMKVRARLTRLRLRKMSEEEPLTLAGIVIGATAIVGAAVWLGVRAANRQ